MLLGSLHEHARDGVGVRHPLEVGIDGVGRMVGPFRFDWNQVGEVAVDDISPLPDRLRAVFGELAKTGDEARRALRPR